MGIESVIIITPSLFFIVFILGKLATGGINSPMVGFTRNSLCLIKIKINSDIKSLHPILLKQMLHQVSFQKDTFTKNTI